MAESTTARQFWIEAPGRGAVLGARLPPRRDHELSIRTLYSGISRGTEALVFRGGVPPSQYQAMRAPFQEGEFPGPVKYGYSNVGRVVEGPDGLAGQVVFCLYPHQDRYVVPLSAVARVPAGVPPGRAVLAANMETAVNVLWDARPVVGDRIVVVGGGVVGLLCAWLCRGIPGAALTLVDSQPRARAGRRGVGDPVPHHAAGARRRRSGHPCQRPSGGGWPPPSRRRGWRASSWRRAGTATGRCRCRWARRSTPGGSRCGAAKSAASRSPARRGGTTRGGWRWPLTLLGDARLDALITGEDRFEDLPRVMARVSRAPGDTLCHRIRY